MILEKGPSFNSKILLFGEYSLIKGSMALSIPYEELGGQLLFDPEANKSRSNHYSVAYLIDYLNFLETNSFKDIIDTSTFRADLENGLYFECNIPISYGLGSSGAIVAAIYHSYSINGLSDDLLSLKTVFSNLESYYHGKSSGLDPLVSYLNKAVLIKENGDLRTVEIPDTKSQNGINIFLIDTKSVGETQPLVSWFLNEYETEAYKLKIDKQLIPFNNSCINYILDGDFEEVLRTTKMISEFSLENFKPMIPHSVKEAWNKGLDTNTFYLKLCGSGGGGMMLGFTKDINKIKEYLHDFEIHLL